MTVGQFFKKNLLVQEALRGFILGGSALSGGGSLGTVLSRIPRPRAVSMGTVLCLCGLSLVGGGGMCLYDVDGSSG